MPSHISVNNLGLTYKGTIGLSMATIPDVCKTPTPGGPVPMPYPNIADQSSLKNGTTTVFAKGGKMIAIKGSQYGRSNGDEPGTVGGVKSNVNMKATDWITYSFDVKMDGKNSCRHTDKKFHNDKNTVDLGGNQDPRTRTTGTHLEILCEGAPKGKTKSGKPRKAYDKCELEEICAKIKAYNDALQGNNPDFTEIKQAGKRYGADGAGTRNSGNNVCKSIKRYARQGRGVGGEGKPADMKFHDVKSQDCKDELKRRAESTRPKYKNFSPDHVQEIQHNGHPTRASNLRWMSRRPNKWIGGAMSDLKTSGPNKHTSISGDCCK